MLLSSGKTERDHLEPTDAASIRHVQLDNWTSILPSVSYELPLIIGGLLVPLRQLAHDRIVVALTFIQQIRRLSETSGQGVYGARRRSRGNNPHRR